MAKPNLSKKWWINARPEGVKGAELEKALAEVERAPSADGAARVLKAIDAVEKELDRKRDRDLLKDLQSLRGMAEEVSEAESNEQEGEDEDPADDQLGAPEVLVAMVKKLRRRALLFSFAVQPKPEDCVFLLKGRGSAKSLLKLAKDRSGSTKVSCGTAAAAADDDSILELRLESPLATGLARMARKKLKQVKSTVFKRVRIVVDGRVAEESGAEEDEEEVLPPLPTEPVSTRERSPEELQSRRDDFKTARGEWVRVKNQVEVDLEKVKEGARQAYLDDPEQFPKIVKGCRDIDAILDHLDDELRDLLDAYAATPLKRQAQLLDLARQAVAVLDRYLEFVSANPVMKAIDLGEFADVRVHKPVLSALRGLRAALL